MDASSGSRGRGGRAPGKLAAVALRKLRDGWHADGGNLYLFVRGSSRAWVFRYMDASGKRRNMGLGSLDSVTLATARQAAADLRAQLRHPTNPLDPLAQRDAARSAALADRAKVRTFAQCADAYIAANQAGWKNAKHTAQWASTIKTYAYPVMGELPVSAIDTAHVLRAIEPIWLIKTETASRVRGRIETVLDWATARKFRDGENPARWRGHLDKLLPKPAKVTRAGHHAALPYREAGAFIAALRGREGIGARALEFAVLTAARSGEVRGATWGEIDLQAGTWTVPGERMKAGRDHRVPLPDAALRLLRALPRLDGEPLVFPGGRRGAALSDMSLTAVLRRMGFAGTTVHGFRSTFRDWAAETTAYPSELAELALAHTISNKVEAAYRRGDMFEKRQRMMDDWARYCATPAGTGDVIPLRRAEV